MVVAVTVIVTGPVSAAPLELIHHPSLVASRVRGREIVDLW
jgi:hypothetical protein